MRVTDDVPKICFSLPLRPIILVVLFTVMTIGFIPILRGQISGDYFYQKYPSCNIPKDRIKLVNDGRCDGGVLNTPQCKFEGGDCRDFNLAYPGCDVSAEAYKVGDGKCNEKFNNEKCKFDGGDCCPVKNSKFLGDGVCHAGYFDTKVCNFDDTDCKEFREKYPNCPQKMNNVTDRNGSPVAIGDGKCEFNVNTTYLFTEECGFSDGDCKECKVDDPSKLANGICDGGKYNTEECNFDGGDCNECNEMLKSKKLNVSKIGDGTCDGHEYHTITACNEDGGDCANCEVDDYFLIGDGTCDGKKYMSEGCSKDGGDCKDCDVEDPFKIGDGVCDGGNYMTVGCNRDGHDCDSCHDNFTVLDNTFVGNGKCDGREFNIEGCDYDGGDCKDCNEKLDNLGLDKDKLGDGTCDGGDYMMIECGRDGGDCDKCKVADPYRIGNGICDVEFNTPECSHDGGDCLVEGLPDCYVEDPSKIKDGKCHGGNYTLKECNYDGGDCKDFVEKYPNCSVPDPEKVTDQTCDAKENSSGEPLYNVASCDYDGGACFTVNNETLQKYPNCSIVSPVEVGWIGNGECNKELNVAACEHDGGDCVDFNNRFPNCTAESPWRLFDKSCFAYLPYNSAECGWDGGDCDELNEKMRVDYPDCKSDSFGLLANDRCDYDLNTDDCGFDDGKCAEFETKYPGCLQFFSNNKFDTRKIGDGHCDGLPFNVDECKYDGGDCDERNNDINNEFPNCHVAQIGVIKDGFCNSAANNEACGWDGGDCLDFNANYLECKTDKPYKISNRHCDPEYNTTECKYDGGDCLL